MIIWFSFIIPIVALVVMAVFFGKKTVWWEYLVLLAVPAAMIAATAEASKASQTRANEFYGGYVTHSRYVEPWNEWVEQTCSRCVSTDKNGNCTSTETYDCSYCSEHGASYDYSASIDGSMFDNEEVWNTTSVTWGKKFVPMHRNSECPFPRNGNAWTSTWNGDSATLVPYFSIHTYENRVQAAPTLFSFREIDPKKTKVFEYPKDHGLENRSILVDHSIANQSKASDLLNWYNAKYGAARQVHAYLIVFHDPSQQRGRDQEAFWKGAGKNELVTTVGLDRNDSVLWAYVFSWSPDKMPSIVIRDSLTRMGKFDAVAAVNLIGQEGVKKFVRKHFRDFKYITIQPSGTAVFVAFLIVTLFSIGWIVFSVKSNLNQYDF